MQLTTLDIVIIVVYAIGLFALAQWVSRSHGQRKDSTDYFLASKNLTFFPGERPFRWRVPPAANPLGHGCVAPEGTP